MHLSRALFAERLSQKGLSTLRQHISLKCNALEAQNPSTPVTPTDSIRNFLFFLSWSYISLHFSAGSPREFRENSMVGPVQASIRPTSGKNTDWIWSGHEESWPSQAARE